MNCSGMPPAGTVLAVASTVAPPRRRRFTMASPIPLLPPVTRVRLPVNSFASYGTLDALMKGNACSMRFLRHDLRLLRGLRRVVNHRVAVFHPDAVSAGLRSKQFHEHVVVFLFRPVALPFEQSCNGRETHCAGLHHA